MWVHDDVGRQNLTGQLCLAPALYINVLSAMQGRIDFLNAVKAGLAQLGAGPSSAAVPVPSN